MMRKNSKFTPPTVEEVREYCESRKNSIDPEYFVAFYETNGWVQGRQGKPIQNWKMCVVTWEKMKSENAFGRNGLPNASATAPTHPAQIGDPKLESRFGAKLAGLSNTELRGLLDRAGLSSEAVDNCKTIPSIRRRLLGQLATEAKQ